MNDMFQMTEKLCNDFVCLCSTPNEGWKHLLLGDKKKRIGWLWVALQLYFLPYFLLLQRSPADILQTGLKIFKVPINKNAINLNMHLEFLF